MGILPLLSDTNCKVRGVKPRHLRLGMPYWKSAVCSSRSKRRINSQATLSQLRKNLFSGTTWLERNVSRDQINFRGIWKREQGSGIFWLRCQRWDQYPLRLLKSIWRLWMLDREHLCCSLDIGHFPCIFLETSCLFSWWEPASDLLLRSNGISKPVRGAFLLDSCSTVFFWKCPRIRAAWSCKTCFETTPLLVLGPAVVEVLASAIFTRLICLRLLFRLSFLIVWI